MKSTIVFKTSDGETFNRESKAISHQQDLVGEALDEFLPQDSRGHLTRVAKHDILLQLLKDPDLQGKLSKLLDLVNHLNDEDEEGIF